MDGGSLQLSDFVGKWVVLAFCNGKTDKYETELMGLGSLWREFQGSHRVTMALIVVEEDLEKARGAAQRAPACPQGYAGPGQTGSVVKDYGVIAVPSVFLIDPEGKIAGYNLSAVHLFQVFDQIIANDPDANPSAVDSSDPRPQSAQAFAGRPRRTRQ